MYSFVCLLPMSLMSDLTNLQCNTNRNVLPIRINSDKGIKVFFQTAIFSLSRVLSINYKVSLLFLCVSEWVIVVQCQNSNHSAISWREQR